MTITKWNNTKVVSKVNSGTTVQHLCLRLTVSQNTISRQREDRVKVNICAEVKTLMSCSLLDPLSQITSQ